MVRVNAFEAMPMNSFFVGGMHGSDKVLNSLLDQSKQGPAANGRLSFQTLHEILHDVACAKLSVEQATRLTHATEQNGQKLGSQEGQGARGIQQTSGTGTETEDGHSDPFLQQVLQDVAKAQISPQTAVQLIQAAEQQGSRQPEDAGGSVPLLQQVLQDVADGQINPQTAAQLILSAAQEGQQGAKAVQGFRQFLEQILGRCGKRANEP